MVANLQPRRRLAAPERRAQLVDAATRAFSADGYADTTIASIAETAGITPRILYQHFDSKEALYRAVILRSAERLQPLLAEPAGPYGIDASRLIEAARADAHGFRVLWRHAAHERAFARLVSPTRTQALACVRDALAPWTPPADLDFAAQSVVSQLFETALVMLEYGDPEDDIRWAKAAKASLSAGVRAWSEGAAPGPRHHVRARRR